MQEENKHLSPAQARHLTVHGANQNEDGTYTWKFDPQVRSDFPFDMRQDELEVLWSRITCPTLLMYGRESWASNPETDGRIRHFRSAEVQVFERAGHWVHHDRTEAFVAALKVFL